jgi:CBS domain-containing protein
MRVRHVMSTDVVTVVREDRVVMASDLVTRVGITGLPVVDADQILLGMVSDLDFVRAYRHGTNLDTLTVGDVMERRSPVVGPDAGLHEAASLMEEWHVRLLPVVHEGRLAGIISRGDVLRGLAQRAHRRLPAGVSVGAMHGSGRTCACVSAAPEWKPGGTS